MTMILAFVKWAVGCGLMYITGKIVFEGLTSLMQPVWNKVFGKRGAM